MPARTGLPAVVAAAITVSGCAGTRPGLSDEPTVELVVHNERALSVAVYVAWQGATRPLRLGVIAAGSSATYLPVFRSPGLCVQTTSIGNTSFSTTVPERTPPVGCNEGIPVERGQRMDVVLRRDGRTCYLQYDPDC
jgi:hypothetical protein